MRASRRTLLLGGAVGGVAAVAGAGALVEYDVLPGRTTAYRVLGLDGEAGVIPADEPGPIVAGVLASQYVSYSPRWVIGYPPGTRPGDPMPVVIALHGGSQDAHSLFSDTSTGMGLGQFLAASGQRYAVAAVDGELLYWHAHASGEDPGRMVLEELVPIMGERGLDVSAPAFLGWSMGGFGALYLSAVRLAGGDAVGPVVVVSPALVTGPVPGAFDGEADYDDCYATLQREPRPLTRIDCGRGDPFYRSIQSVTDGWDAETHWSAGAHTLGYRRRVLPDEMVWLGEHL